MKNQKKKRRKSDLIWILLAACFAVLAVVCFAKALSQMAEHRAAEKEFRALSDVVSGLDKGDLSTAPEENRLERYAELAEQNPDFFGWIRIEGTPIDYPVMHTPEHPEKYLHADFEGEKSSAGTIFMDYRCREGSDNLLLHGHNMKNDTMFGTLSEYENQAYWQEHPVIRFDTLEEEGEYEILAAFYDRVYLKTDTCFKYYNFIEAADEAEFDRAIRSFQEKSIYDTGVTAHYGDQLLTLSTCSYQTDNGRFVVVARKTA